MILSVIIPALNEAEHLPGLLESLRAQSGVDLEIVVADGGSSDATVACARAAGATVVRSARGRGLQMNAGAAASRGERLLFLHADTRLDSPTLLRDAVGALTGTDDDACAGHFPLRFLRTQPGHDLLYRYLEGKTRLNRPYTINGDQGLLISRRYFNRLGGYDTRLPFLEDQRLSARIFATGRWLVLPGALTTSARRFESEGHRERLAVMALMMGAHAVGLDDFFTRAPDVYRAQAETARLQIAAFAGLIRQLIREQGWAGWRTLYRGGRFVRENAWQVFYRCDRMRNDGRDTALRFHDRVFARLVANPVGDLLAMALLCGWLYAVLPRR